MSSTEAPDDGIDLNPIYQAAVAGIFRAYVFTRFGSRGLSVGGFEETAFPGQLEICVVPEPMPQSTVNEYVVQFKAWVVGNGLRELVETVSDFLEQIYQVGVDLSHSSDLTIQLKRFHQLSLRGKVQKLREDLQITGIFAEHFESLTAIRNALTHGSGRVRQRDCTSEGTLRVTWLGLDAHFVAENGVRYRVGDQPNGVELREPLEIVRPLRERIWREGERVILAPLELAEICFMAKQEILDVVDELRAFAKRRGKTLRPVDEVRGGPSQ